MLRPERMASTSIICVKKDVESVLEALNGFGQFHIEETPQDNATLAEYYQSIQKVEISLADANSLINQLVHEKTSLLSMFKVTYPKQVPVTAENWQNLLNTTGQQIALLKSDADDLNTAIAGLQEKNAQLTHIKDMLSRLQSMGADLAAMEDLKLIYVATVSAPARNYPALETALSGLPIFINRCNLAKDTMFLCLAIPTKHKVELERILHTYHAEIFHVPEELPHNIDEALKEVNHKLKENAEKEKHLTDALKKLGDDNIDNLASWKETSENILALLHAETKILQSGRLATIKGYTPKGKFDELSAAITKMLDGKVLVLKDDAVESVHNDSKEQPPTRILNSRFIRPFEELTKLYGLPNYSEIDPTPFMAITFPILFGLMFGDLGQGLVFLIGGLTLGYFIKSNQGMKNVCYIMAACGLAAAIAGVLFGEFFGMELEWALVRPSEDVFSFLIFSLFVGIVQICCGIVLEGINFALKHDMADALLTSLPKILFYIGGIYIIATYQLNFSAWLSGPILAAIIPFVILVVGKPTYLAIKKPKVHATSEHAEMDTLSGRLFEGGDFFTRLLSNTISYSRILALLMAHWALMLAVYSVAGIIGTGSLLTSIVAGIIVVGGNIFVMALEGLIVFIHTLRLHFYEWFSKFYAGTGVEFSPFKQNFTHTKLTLKRETAPETATPSEGLQ
jgi:V/A-type H+-transporting ATPase subunit I